MAEAQLYGDPFLPPLVESAEQLRKVLETDAVVLKAVLDGRLVGAVRAQFSDHPAWWGASSSCPTCRAAA